MKNLFLTFLIATVLASVSAHAEETGISGQQIAKATNTDKTSLADKVAELKPYRTFVTIQRYNMESNGDSANPISNVRIEITFPNNEKIQLPEGGQFWPIGNGQVQEINRTFEIPWAYIKNDGFTFNVQMVRKGAKLLPCQFEVQTLSQFNRGYVCHTDVNWQLNQSTPEEKLNREGIQVRVFTDKNSKPSEIPNDTIAVR